MAVRQYNNVKQPVVRRNRFNLSHTRLMSCDMFYLYPHLVEDCIPGDKWRIGCEVMIRNNPLMAPIMHEQDCYLHYFFVPYRLLWRDFEEFISPNSGEFVGTIPTVKDVVNNTPWSAWQEGGIGDYFGYPPVETNWNEWQKAPDGFLMSAMLFIYNEYYRDQNLQPDYWEMFFLPNIKHPTINLTYFESMNVAKAGIFKRGWRKDYFTSALPWQQRGTVPAFDLVSDWSQLRHLPATLPEFRNEAGPTVTHTKYTDASMTAGISASGSNPGTAEARVLAMNQFLGTLSHHSTTPMILNSDVHDMRLAFQITLFMEKNARTGSRYVEFLKAHFPAYPRDDRLQRPEYIGGHKIPVITSEVLQNSEAGSSGETGVGSMYGHGMGLDSSRIATYNVQEHGCIIGLMSFMPTSMYMDGLERVWGKESRYDFYFPSFANLSEQAIRTWELYNYADGYPVEDIFGYQGRYDEYRFRRNSVHGLFRSDFKHWHMGRKFATAPSLNQGFIFPSEDELWNTTTGEGLKRVLQVPTEPQYLVYLQNKLDVVRPLPYIAQPGLIDHSYS